ncbi:MAG: HAD-IB family phosphatase [Acidimicrobiales bacterium]
MSGALSVFFDFDGTVTRTDTGVHLLERLATADWRIDEALYASGRIGSRECLARHWELLTSDEGLLRSTAREVEVDVCFGPLVAALKRAGAEVTVVSDGFGFFAEEVCAAHGVEVMTNVVDWPSGRLTFPNLDRCCPCSTCGTCKQAPIKDARRRGRTTVFVGDGISDRKAALLADVLFAKHELADWCEEVGVDYRPFGTLGDVARGLGVDLGVAGRPC